MTEEHFLPTEFALDEGEVDPTNPSAADEGAEDEEDAENKTDDTDADAV